MNEDVMKYTLLTSQKNEVFTAVQNAGFAPSSFSWGSLETSEQYNTEHVPALFLTGTDYYFVFDRSERHFILLYSPGKEKNVASSYSIHWAGVVPILKDWLHFVKRETELPDLWESLIKEHGLADSVSQVDQDNAPLSPEERIQIAEGLREIKYYLLSAKTFSEDQQKFIEGRFEYLEQSSSRLGRKDWLNILIGTLLSTALTAGLDAVHTRGLLSFAGAVVRRLFESVLNLPFPH